MYLNFPITKSLRRLLYAIGFSFASIVIGVSGYMVLEGYRFTEALYMTVITVSTVGFNEVKQLSEPGRIFTSFYILSNLGVFAYLISTLTTYIFEGELNKILKSFMQGREFKNVRNHTIVCGFGRNGIKAVSELRRSNERLFIIEKDESSLENFPENLKYNVILGDATLDETLLSAGIQRARSIITTLPSDADNVFISLTARELNPNVVIIARASDEKSGQKLRRAGADHVVMPDALGGLHMAQIITKPYVIELLNVLNNVSDNEYILEEVSYEDVRPEFRDKSLRELDFRNKSGVSVLGIKDNNVGLQFTPGADTIIHANLVLIVLGKKASFKKLKDNFLI